MDPAAKAAPPAPTARGRPVHHHLARLAVDYLRLRYIGRYLHVFDHLRALPRLEAWIALLMLGLVAAVVVAMPALVWLGVRLPAVAFQAIDGSPAAVPRAGLALTLLVFGTGWAYVLVGSALGPGLLWLLVAAQFIYFVVFIGLAMAPTYLQLAPLLLIVAVGALTPGIRPWAQYLLIALVASLIVRTPPFVTTLHTVPWQATWLPVMYVLIVAHHALARRAWPSAAGRVGLAAAGTCLYLAAVVARAAPEDVATVLNISLNGTFEILSLLWFVLGASFIGGGIALAKFVRDGLEALAPDRVLPWLAGAGWLALAVWAAAGSPAGTDFPIAAASLAALFGLLAGLAVAARRGRLSRDWWAGWLVASLAAVLVLRAYGTQGVRNVVDAAAIAEARAGALSLAAFLYAITWEVGGEIPHIPLSTSRLARPSPLLLYLGGVALISGAALFGTTSHLADFQKYIILNEYEGAVALSIPLGLLAAARTWPVLSPGVLARAVAAFYWAAVLAVPVLLLRWAGGGAAAGAAVLAAPALLAAALVTRWPEARGVLAAAAVGCASGLGFAVSFSQRVLAGVLQDVLQTAAALTKSVPAHEAALGLRSWLAAAASGAPDERLLAAATVLSIVISCVAVLIGRDRKPTAGAAAT